MNDTPVSTRLDRRRFLQLATLAGLGVGARAVAAAPTAPAARPAVPTPAAAKREAISEDARAVISVLRRRYPSALTAAQWELVARDVDGDLAAGKRLRALALTNADEPDVIFRP